MRSAPFVIALESAGTTTDEASCLVKPRPEPSRDAPIASSGAEVLFPKDASAAETDKRLTQIIADWHTVMNADFSEDAEVSPARRLLWYRSPARAAVLTDLSISD